MTFSPLTHVSHLLRAVTLAAAICSSGEFASAQGWALAWSDEFSLPDGSAPDASKWGYDTGGGGWGNNELQYYTSRTNNARIEGGKLVIEAKQENFGGRNYTSARLLTKGKWDWTYGRMEARIKIPRGQGIWPAFWMLGSNIDSADWPACGEIDIMENIGKEPSIIHGTIHGPGYSGGASIGGSFTLNGGAVFADDYHVFAAEWETNRIRWFVDDQLYFTATPRSLPSGAPWVFTGPEFIIMNVAVGGYWPGVPDASTVFPQKMLVDYVRVFSFTNAVECGGNVLANPGFETGGLAGWSAYGAGFNTSIASSPVKTGTNSFKVFGQFNGGDNYSGVFQDKPCSPGDAFTAAAFLHTLSGDKISGPNTAWVEVSFRNTAGTILSIYRSAIVSASSPANQWLNLQVTNQLNTSTFAVIGSASTLIAPPDSVFVRAQVVFRQQSNAGGSVYVDDLSLVLPGPGEIPVQVVASNLGSELQLSFQSVLSANYQIQYKESLSSAIWSPLTVLPGNGAVCSVNEPFGPGRRFYRVVRLCN